MKHLVCPPFRAVGLVDAFEHGSSSPVVTVQVDVYLSHHDGLTSSMVRDAQWRLQRAGVPKERLDELYFEYAGTTHLFALEPKGVRRVDGEPVEAFFDFAALPKRDVLIRQRRLVPDDHEAALQIYAAKHNAARAAGVPA